MKDAKQVSRLLIVDDEPRICRTLARIFAARFEVVTCESGQSARAVLEQDSDFDVILCDMMMQPGTGGELYEWLEQHRPALAERIVLMSGGVVDPQERAVLARVGERTVEKPFNIPRLIQLVEEVAAKSR